MKGHRLVAEHPNSFEIQHPDGSRFHVAKGALSMPMVVQLSKLPRVEHDDAGTQPDSATQPSPEDSDPEYNGIDKTIGDVWNKVKPYVDFDAPPVGDPVAAPSTDGATIGADSAPAGTPAAPDQAPTTPNTNPNYADPTLRQQLGSPQQQNPFAQSQGTMEKAFGEERAGIAGGAKAASDYATAAAPIQAKLASDMQGQNALQAMDEHTYQAQNQELANGIANSKIDPSRVWSQASTGSKIAAGIGVLLSGIGSGLTGQPNMAMGVIQKTIDRDIDAQRADLGKKENLLSMNYRRLGDMRAAYAATRSQLIATAQGQLQSQATKMGGAQAQAAAQKAYGDLDIQRAQSERQAAAYGAFYQGGQGQQQGGGVDMSRLRLGAQMGIIPSAQATSALKEAGDYQKLTNSLGSVDQAFNTVGKLQTVGNRVGSPIQSKHQIDATRKLYSAQLAKDLEGRATPQDIDSLMENFPELTDSAETKAQKRVNLHNSIKSKFSFPTLQAYGLMSPNDPSVQPTVGLSGAQTIVKGS